jgi:hypothetical protein
MSSRLVAFGVALAALDLPAFELRAQQSGVTPAPSHRVQLVRKEDGEPIGGAELFDLPYGPDLKLQVTMELRKDPDREMPKLARRLVADDDGFVELGPDRWHTLLARAPGRYRYLEYCDFWREPFEKLGLYDDAPLVVEVVDAHGLPVEGAIVECRSMMICGNDVMRNDPWRAVTAGDGHVALPHYWRVASDDSRLEPWLELQNPVQEPPRVAIGVSHSFWKIPHVDEGSLLVRWQLPPLSRIRVEFVGTGTLPPEDAVTFEMVGPNQYFGEPDRYTGGHGKPLELLTETGVTLRACFHWRPRERGLPREPDLRVFGAASPDEGGTALLRIPVASDPVALRLRPVRGDGAAFPSASSAAAKVRTFDVSLQWFDREGFRFCTNFCRVAPDEAGALRVDWPRPRFDEGERPAKLRVSLRDGTNYYGWEPLEPSDLVAREIDWPPGDALDVGTFVVPGSGG